MRKVIISGKADSAETVFEQELPHGVSPAALAGRLGWAVEHPRSAELVDDEIVLSLRVSSIGNRRVPIDRPRGRDADLVISPSEPITRRQRVAAYALVTADPGLLATEFSERTAVAGQWGLPGGGIDPGEQPRDSVLREVVEETNQHIDLGELVEVQSSHWIGRAPSGIVEDFQAIRLVYTATCPNPTEPEVLDVGGTTEQSRWVPLSVWADLPWTAGWRDLLTRLLAPPPDPAKPL